MIGGVAKARLAASIGLVTALLVWGALPFTWSTGPWERFRLYEVQGDEKR